MSSSSSSSSSSSPKGDAVPYARLCHIVKWEDFDGYGFNLHAEKGKSGQFIGKVDEGSPSQAAGLRQGDRIVEVNEINIANESHKQVVDRIKAFPNETKLLVVDQEADGYFKTNGVVVKGTMTHVKVIKTPDKSPAIEQEAGSVGSNHSIDENVHKSIGSNSGSDSTVAVALANDSPGTEQARQNGNGGGDGNANANGNGNDNDNDNDNEHEHEHEDENENVTGEDKGLNLKMSAKELRARLAARKKYDPKKESIGFKDKFDIVQKL